MVRLRVTTREAVLQLLSSFNSKMVRLRVPQGILGGVSGKMFQFQDGAIKRLLLLMLCCLLLRFNSKMVRLRVRMI